MEQISTNGTNQLIKWQRVKTMKIKMYVGTQICEQESVRQKHR